MKRLRKKGVFVLAAAAVTAWYTVRTEGALRPVQPAVTVTFPAVTLVTPAVYSSDAEANAVYVVFGGPRVDARFDATRVDARTGSQSPSVIAIGPGSGFSPFTEGEVSAEVKGLSLRRPAFHLFSLPDGRGPGVRLADSDTGVVRLTIGDGAARRTLMTRWALNSSTTSELRSLASTDAAGKYVAVVAKSSAGWTLHLFHQLPEES